MVESETKPKPKPKPKQRVLFLETPQEKRAFPTQPKSVFVCPNGACFGWCMIWDLYFGFLLQIPEVSGTPILYHKNCL
jgi:hypothetical protein